ncbi:putative bifunctional diguanylate cyclase/phosphodiesterase [Microbacterium album]|nr:EAL domain-containing protein [Microbacterium album]
MTPVHHLLHSHDPALLLLALLLCIAGAWATSRFFPRLVDSSGNQRIGWIFLTALSTGVSIWCTHFVAMLAYQAGTAVTFDRFLTMLSLVVAVGGGSLGIAIAGTGRNARVRPAIGGAVVGLSIAVMHYMGMVAYRVHGTVTWDVPLVALSVAFSIGVSAAALYVGRRAGRRSRDGMWALLVLSVLLLHFTGMAAFHVVPAASAGEGIDPESLRVLGMTIVFLSLVVISAGVAGYLIDSRGRADTVARLQRLAMHDALTGLPNRASFNERLNTDIEWARAEGERLALVVIDINDFKDVNDLRGHAAGDEVLRVIGARLGALTAGREGEFVARVGGDEFTALVRVLSDAEPGAFLTRLEEALSAPIWIQAERDEIVPRASIGVAMFPDDATDGAVLTANADLAMYRAKAGLQHGVCFYDAELDERTRLRRGLGADLRQAVARGELILHYQVQTSLQTGAPRGYEALIRWEHPRLGTVPPGSFIPLAEESGLIVPIGEWVLRTACAEAATWDPPYRIAVNVSAVQLTEQDLAGVVRDVLDETGLAPARLELELTESAVFADKERAQETLRAIKAMGVGIALDDFGSGYSSLEVLRSFPFDRIKIDRSVIASPGTEQETLAFVQAIMSMGRIFGMSALAEGVETPEQLAVLRSAGCEEAQGFLFGRPEPVEAIRAARTGDPTGQPVAAERVPEVAAGGAVDVPDEGVQLV